jgi:hypothetical protein
MEFWYSAPFYFVFLKFCAKVRLMAIWGEYTYMHFSTISFCRIISCDNSPRTTIKATLWQGQAKLRTLGNYFLFSTSG